MSSELHSGLLLSVQTRLGDCEGEGDAGDIGIRSWGRPWPPTIWKWGEGRGGQEGHGFHYLTL